jgi:hypothetical protein
MENVVKDLQQILLGLFKPGFFEQGRIIISIFNELLLEHKILEEKELSVCFFKI